MVRQYKNETYSPKLLENSTVSRLCPKLYLHV